MFNPGIAIGQVLTEDEVHDIFECQITVGIRLSTKNNLIVIMSGSAKKKVYDDVWDEKNDILFYSGTDINADEQGNQTLITGNGNNNSQLRDVWYNKDKEIFLFVKKESNKCIYKGKVFLCEEPYMDWKDEEHTCKKWVFPLKLASENEEENLLLFHEAEVDARKQTLDNLYRKSKDSEEKRTYKNVPKKRDANVKIYDRNPNISAYIKARANGKCDLCENEAPFLDKEGYPYLEAHHIKWLSKGGPDEIDNMVALCPNCHKRMHILDYPDDVTKLKDKIKEYKKIELSIK